MNAKENLFPLKILVFSLGAVLIGGMLLLAGVVWKKAASAPAPVPNIECVNAVLDLKGKGMVVESIIEGSVLRLTLQKKEGESQIISVNTCNGEIINTLSIHADPGLDME